MYYEKLLSIYKNSRCSESFSLHLVRSLDQYILWSLNKNKKNLSPYKFARLNSMLSSEAIKFFMYFSGNDKVFGLEYFFECSDHACSERIYIESQKIQSHSDDIYCEYCGNSYNVKDIQKYIKVYFVLNSEFYNKVSILKSFDPNSAMDTINNLPDHLKSSSLSSSNKFNSQLDGGEDHNDVNLSMIVEINESTDIPIIEDEFLLSMGAFIHD